MINIQYVDSEEYVQLAQGESYVISPSPILVLRYVSPRNSPALLEEEGGTGFLVECRQDVTFSNNLPVTITSLNEPGTLSIRRRTPDGLQDGGTSVALAADAVSIRGVPVAAIAPGDSDVLVYSESEHNYSPEPQSGGGGGGGTDAESIQGFPVTVPTAAPSVTPSTKFPFTFNYTAGVWEVSSIYSASKIELCEQDEVAGQRYAYLQGLDGTDGVPGINVQVLAGSADPEELVSAIGAYITLHAGIVSSGVPVGGNLKLNSGDATGATFNEGAFIELAGAQEGKGGDITLHGGAAPDGGGVGGAVIIEAQVHGKPATGGLYLSSNSELVETGVEGVDRRVGFASILQLAPAVIQEGEIQPGAVYVQGGKIFTDEVSWATGANISFNPSLETGGNLELRAGEGYGEASISPAAIFLQGSGTTSGMWESGSVTIQVGFSNDSVSDTGFFAVRAGSNELISGYATGGGVGKVGFFNASPVAKPTVTGSRGGNAALASLLTALADLGLITNSTSA